MGRGHGVVAVWVLAVGCGDDQSRGRADGADAAAGTPDGAATDAATPEVSFEDRTWGEPEPLGQGKFPSAAIDAAGTVMTLWHGTAIGFNGCIARRRVLDSGWEPDVVLVTPQAVHDELEEPGKTEVSFHDYCDARESVAIDADGRAIALLDLQRTLRDDETNGVENWHTGMRAMFDPVTGWAEPERSGPNDRDSFDFGVAMNAAGAGLIAWTDDGQTWATDYLPFTGWHEPGSIEMVGAGFVYDPRAALTADGDAMVTWTLSGAGDHLRVARRVAGVWTETAQIDDAKRVRVGWDVALNSMGEAVVIWRDCEGPGDVGCEMRARRLDRAGVWEASVALGDAGDDDNFGRNDLAEVAIDEQGNGLAAWISYWPDPAGGDPLPRIDASVLQDGVWTAVETIGSGAAGDERLGPRVVLDRRGNGLVSWGLRRLEAKDRYISEVVARPYMPETGFGPLERLEESHSYIYTLELAMNPAGIGVAVWNDDDVAVARMFR